MKVFSTKKLIYLCAIGALALTLLFLASQTNSISQGEPGAHCGEVNDPPCREDLVCHYHRCLAKPFAFCNSGADCAGPFTNLMDCFNGQCLGRHGYHCGNPPQDSICAPGFHCHQSDLGYNYCVAEEPPQEDPFVDIKANGEDGPLSLYYKDEAVLTWTSKNVDSCQAFGDWSGEKESEGSLKFVLGGVKKYEFGISCQKNGKKTEDKVIIKVDPKLPIVLTKAVVTTF